MEMRSGEHGRLQQGGEEIGPVAQLAEEGALEHACRRGCPPREWCASAAAGGLRGCSQAVLPRGRRASVSQLPRHRCAAGRCVWKRSRQKFGGKRRAGTRWPSGVCSWMMSPLRSRSGVSSTSKTKSGVSLAGHLRRARRAGRSPRGRPRQKYSSMPCGVPKKTILPPLSSSSALSNICNSRVLGWWMETKTILLCASERMISSTCSESLEERPEVGSSKR